MSDTYYSKLHLAVRFNKMRPSIIVIFVRMLSYFGTTLGQEHSPDLLVTPGYILFNRGDGSFLSVDIGGRFTTTNVSIGDFNADGILDIASGAGLWLGLGDGYFGVILSPVRNEEACFWSCANAGAIADLNADGIMDFLYACTGKLYIFYGTGTVKHGDGIYFEPGPVIEMERFEHCEGNIVLEVGDFDEDGLVDVYAGQSPFSPLLYFNDGNGIFTGVFNVNSGEFVKVIDFDQDGHLDIVSLFIARQVIINKGDGSGKFSYQIYDLSKEDGWNLHGLVFSDLNQDNNLDIATLHLGRPDDGSPAKIFILFGLSDGNFGEVRSIELPLKTGQSWNDFMDITSEDFNGDALQDLAIVRYVADDPGLGFSVDDVIWIFYGKGNGDFSDPVKFAGPPHAARIFSIGDIDRRFIRGDANDDQVVDISDAVTILLTLFLGAPVSCGKAMDTNDDSIVDITDVIYLLTYIFLGGEKLPAPYPNPGIDETHFYDLLGCSPLTWELLKNRR